MNELCVWCPPGIYTGTNPIFIYMSDICFTSKLLRCILFADDRTVFHLDNDINFLYDTVNRELQEVCNWFKLSLNSSKTI